MATRLLPHRNPLTARELRLLRAETSPPACASALSTYLLHRHKGRAAVIEMITDDIRAALTEDEICRARSLYATLQQFISHISANPATNAA